MCDLSTSLLIARMNSVGSATRDPRLNNERNAVGRLRGDNLLIEAFLETAAPRGANVVLVVVLLLGIATYTRWYVPHLFQK
jgi:hypothetical protein